jgi:hypothetical protein
MNRIGDRGTRVLAGYFNSGYCAQHENVLATHYCSVCDQNACAACALEECLTCYKEAKQARFEEEYEQQHKAYCLANNLCLCGAPMKDGFCSVEDCICSRSSVELRRETAPWLKEHI